MMATTETVSQRAREVAADYWRDFIAKVGEVIVENAIRRGDMDAHESVQRFARFEREVDQSNADRVRVLEAENARLTQIACLADIEIGDALDNLGTFTMKGRERARELRHLILKEMSSIAFSKDPS